MRTLPPPQIQINEELNRTYNSINYALLAIRYDLDYRLRKALEAQVDQNVCGYVEGMMEYWVGHRNLFIRYKQWGNV